MSFLDRFKSQPKWKNADPAVRAAAVPEIPDDAEHHGVLLELALSDEEIRVRRAAAARLTAAEDLVRVTRSETDADLRHEISERLVGIAIAGADTDAQAALALEGLEDQKQFGTVAKSSPHETIRTAALARVHDVKILSSIARNAASPQTALEAAARVADGAELFNIAVRTDHKDAGIAALERAAELGEAGPQLRETLDGIGERAKNKGVARRARAMVQAIDEAAAAQRLALEHWQQRVAAVLARVEAIAAAPSVPDAPAQLAGAETEFREVAGTTTFEVDPDTAARFGTLVEAARAAIAQHERQEAERRAEADRQAAFRAARTSLCERVEAIRGDDAPAALEQARREWTSLHEDHSAAEDAELTARFEDACRRAAERHEHRLEILRVNTRLDELSQEAERLVAQEEFPESAWQAVVREWHTLLTKADGLDESVTARFAAADARVHQRAEERRAAAERALRQQVQRVEQLIDRANKRAPAEDLTLREADRLARELRNALEAPPAVPSAEQAALGERLKAAQAAVAPRLHELREMDEWKRFANAAVQEELIARTEALRAKFPFDAPDLLKPEDLENAARELHDIQERWKLAAEAPRAQAQALWHRYRQAADPIQVRVREFFAQRSEERKGNLERKLALIERAEALADSTDWIKTAEELKHLQAEWQSIGPVPRQDTRVTWKRFREACDKFFTRRNADLAQRKETWAANLAKKEALCVRAEEIAASKDWERGAAEIRRLQAEWKTIGPVRRNKSETIWQRFRAACDTFFDRYKRRDEIELEEKQADREALVTEMETLVPAGPEATGGAPEVAGVLPPPQQPEPIEQAALLERVRSLRTRWNQSSPAVRHGADPLSARFVSALERLIAAYPDAFRGTELDVEANRHKMEKLCEKVEGFLTEQTAVPAGSSQALAAMLREALAANTIGGRAGEESKWKAMAEDVRQAQASWSRLGPVPGEAGRQLADRFHRATNRFFDQYRRRVPQQQTQRGGRPVAAR